jgi:transposase-like protein
MTRNYVHARYQHGDDPEIAALYLEGKTAKEIADRFGVCDQSILRSLERQGIPRRPAGKRKVWTGSADQRERVISMYRSGESVRGIAQALGCRSPVISDTLEGAGIVRRPHGTEARAISDEEIPDLVRAYQAGAHATELAKKYGTSHTTIRNYLKAEGVKLRQGGSRWSGSTWRDDAVERYRAGEDIPEISAALGISERGITALLREREAMPQYRQARRINSWRWRGGRFIDRQGYVRVKIPDEHAHLVRAPIDGAYALEHRLIMAVAMGRPLRRTETVHHVNGDKTDNRLENLQLRQGGHGKGVVFRCASCGSHDVEAVPL